MAWSGESQCRGRERGDRRGRKGCDTFCFECGAGGGCVLSLWAVDVCVGGKWKMSDGIYLG